MTRRHLVGIDPVYWQHNEERHPDDEIPRPYEAWYEGKGATEARWDSDNAIASIVVGTTISIFILGMSLYGVPWL